MEQIDLEHKKRIKEVCNKIENALTDSDYADILTALVAVTCKVYIDLERGREYLLKDFFNAYNHYFQQHEKEIEHKPTDSLDNPS